jgi:hypothetical protein
MLLFMVRAFVASISRLLAWTRLQVQKTAVQL